ncbi:Bcr/CflA family efflux MFS transporter [Actinomyces sp. 2119]|uniref:multidrug effflux MFS transporter n=1 Tax=Actinomyces sp. 2119 TaxID=2321393 RepID=UPI000E6CE62D|nr:multidrug effflux MFS transporter [Actinomyces sp. 2119]RJF44840.1 Bcr/CflA family efflux MFS transporter [Actinomyces sp. 2119]
MTSLSSRPAAASTGLLLALAVQNAVPPFATDMYSPAFPEVTADLHTSATSVGLTLTAFFVGMALGQLVGGPVSDQRGRRLPMVAGGLVCTVGAVVCALAPNITVLVLGRLLQGLGGGAAAVVGRSVLVDVAHGDMLARFMSILMAVSALAPMVAPVAGGAVLTVGTWRAVFWCLMGFGLLMTATAALLVPETLPPHRRQSGGTRRLVSGVRALVARRRFVGYMLTSAFSGFAMFAYISSSSFILQGITGLSPMAFSLFFASTAGSQMLLSVVNANLVTRVRPHRLVALGLSVSAVGVIVVAVSVVLLDVALVPLCAGFLMVMSAQAFVFGNSSALALGEVRHVAGAANALLGLAQAVANATAAPLASSGGSDTAVPMVVVMVVGVTGAWAAYTVVGRTTQRRHLPEA